MKQKNILLAKSNWDDYKRRRKVFLTNPVFIKGLALAPIVVAATTAMNSLILSLAVLMLLTPTRMVTSFITRRMSVPFKTFFYPLTSAIIFGFVYYMLFIVFGSRILSLSIYLPILIVDPLIVKNFEKTRKESFTYSIINGLRNTAGFVVACMLVGTIREFLSFGTIFNFEIISISLFPVASESFGGFLIVGIICAIWANEVKKHQEKILNHKEAQNA